MRCHPSFGSGTTPQCLEVQQLIGGSLNRLRDEIVSEIKALAEERLDSTKKWWQQLPPHIAKVYYNQEHDQISQIPILLELLERTGMPQLEALSQDLQGGFAVTGVLHPGAGWLLRADQRYEFPVMEQAFQRHNKHYTIAKLKSRRVDPEWQVMLRELKDEIMKGRMSGPYSSPSWWPVNSIGLDDHEMMQLPNEEVTFSFCFSVKQTDKVRRCEDFRRCHSGGIWCSAPPRHQGIHSPGNGPVQPESTTKDLGSGSQRGLPAVPGTEPGRLLLRPFDTRMALGRETPCTHVRGRQFCLELQQSGRQLDVSQQATFSMHSWPLRRWLHWHWIQWPGRQRLQSSEWKRPRRSRPQRHRRYSGSTWPSVRRRLSSHRTLTGAQRQERWCRMSCGPTGCLQTMPKNWPGSWSSMFGQLGKAALQPIYARAHGMSSQDHSDDLSGPLRSALRTLITLLSEISPRVIPRKFHQPAVVIYTDAYFVLDGKQHSLSTSNLPVTWNKIKC